VITRRNGGGGETQPRNLGPLSAILAASCWGTIGLAVSLLPADADPLSVAAGRMVVGGALMLVTGARPSAIRQVLKAPRARLWLILAAAAMAAHQLTYFTAISKAGPALAAVVLMSSVPVFAGLLAWLGGKSLSQRWFITTTGAVIGCTLLVVNGIHTADHVVVGTAFAILAGVALVMFSTLVARLVVDGQSRTTVSLVFGVTGLLMAPVLLSRSWQWLASPIGSGVVLYLALAATLGAYRLYAHALRTVSVPVTSTLILAEPAVATLLSILILGAHLPPAAWAGLALIFITLLAAAGPTPSWRRRSRQPRHAHPAPRPIMIRQRQPTRSASARPVAPQPR
jgi:DME family drug/metabolite transporter